MSLLGRYISTKGVTLNGSNVSAWADQSGNGNDFDQVVAINQPEFVSNVIKGFPVIRFNTTQFLESIGTSGLNVGTNDLTLVFVGIAKSNTNDRAIVKKQQGGLQRYQLLINNNKGLGRTVDAPLNFYTILSAPYTNFTNHLIMITRWNTTPNTMEMHVDGVLDNDTTDTSGTVTGSLDTTTKALIGNFVNSMDADLLEIRIYDSGENFATLFTELNDLYSGQFVPPPIPSGAKIFLSGPLFKD